MLRCLTILFLLYFTFVGKSQIASDFKTNFTPLLTTGELPHELNKTALEKTNEVLSTLNVKDKNYKVQKEFYETTVFGEDELLKSGQVVFNSRLNKYINNIADVILKNNPELRSKLTFYVIKENESNAWENDNGHIYITPDFIARFNTEAQLAMILCHEIAHYLNKHQFTRFVERAKIIKALNSTYNNDTLWKKEWTFYKIQESQADLEGLELLKKTEYNTKNIQQIFDLMLLSDYSFENTEFEINYFNKDHFKINPGIFYKEVKPISVDANYDDTYDTHPNIYKRKKAIEENLKTPELPIGKDFIVSESEFYYLRDLCRFETVKIDLKDYSLATCFYHAYCLQKKYPDNEFLKQIIAASLYQMAVHKSYKNRNGGFYDYIEVKDNVKSNANRDSAMGYISQIKKMFTRLNGEDFTLLAINYTYLQYKQTEYKNQQYKRCLDTLFNILHNIHNFNYKDFYKNIDEYNQRTIYVHDTVSKNRNFVDAIDRKSAFLNYMTEKEFISFFKDTVSTNEFGIKYIAKGRTKSINSPSSRNKDNLEGNRKFIEYNKQELKSLSKIILQEPKFEKLIYKKYDIEYYPVEAYTNAHFFKTELINVLNKNNITVHAINDSKYNNNETEKYNDIGLINNIIDENDEHYKMPSLLVFNAKSHGAINSKYNTPFVMQIYLNEIIYDDVKFYVNGFPITRDIKTIVYAIDLVNVETGIIAYRRIIESSLKVNAGELKKIIDTDIENIINLKNN